MKHFIAFLTSIALAICLPTMSAAKVIDTHTGQTMPDNTSTAAIRSVENTAEGIVITYTFPYIAVDSVMHNGEWHYILSFEDFPDCGVEDEVIMYVTDALTGANVLKHVCDPTLSEQTIDISGIPSGVYVAVLMINGVIESSLTFFN